MIDVFTGNLLVASSLVSDPIYAGGVCLVVHQDDANVIGVMINRPMKPSAEALLEVLEQSKEESDQPAAPANRLGPIENEATAQPSSSPWGMLHFGGPLSGPVVAIHQMSKYAETETANGVYVAAQKNHLENLVRRQVGPYRLIIGHVAWETQQLRDEIDAGLWHMIPANRENVFSAAGDMWSGLIRRATSNSLARWIGTPDVVGASELN